MPTYEYECESCGKRFEIRQHMTDDPITECPVCGKHVKRLLSGGIGIEFRGSGFYVNDSHQTYPTKTNTDKNCKSCDCNKCRA